jgi:hypothetical protein
MPGHRERRHTARQLLPAAWRACTLQQTWPHHRSVTPHLNGVFANHACGHHAWRYHVDARLVRVGLDGLSAQAAQPPKQQRWWCESAQSTGRKPLLHTLQCATVARLTQCRLAVVTPCQYPHPVDEYRHAGGQLQVFRLGQSRDSQRTSRSCRSPPLRRSRWRRRQ